MQMIFYGANLIIYIYHIRKLCKHVIVSIAIYFNRQSCLLVLSVGCREQKIYKSILLIFVHEFTPVIIEMFPEFRIIVNINKYVTYVRNSKKKKIQ